MEERISIMVATKDRWSELALLIQSLRTQSYQNWDLIICDESSNPTVNSAFLSMLYARIQQEGHKLKIFTNAMQNGVCFARNLLIDANEFDNKYSARLDDDVILERDYLRNCITVLQKGYHIASGITPHMAMSEWERLPVTVFPIINDIELDKEGNIIKYNDDCGYSYMLSNLEESILPATNFRSNAVYLSGLDLRYETNLSKVGFREEAFFSLRAILKGYKIGIHLGAKCYHFQTPSGGCRFPDYAQCVQQDEATFRKWVKDKFEEHGDFITEYRKKVTK